MTEGGVSSGHEHRAHDARNWGWLALILSVCGLVFGILDWFYFYFVYPHTEEGSMADELAYWLSPLCILSWGAALVVLSSRVGRAVFGLGQAPPPLPRLAAQSGIEFCENGPNFSSVQRNMLLSKIHRAAVTDASVDYEGSMAIDVELMQACGMVPYERILVTNMSNAQRFETYAIEAPAGSKAIQLNGAAALLGKPGDRVTIMSFAMVQESDVPSHRARVIVLDEKNEIINRRGI